MLQLLVCQMLREKYSRPRSSFPVRAGDSLQEGQQVEHPVD
jgi:hypothetical protein